MITAEGGTERTRDDINDRIIELGKEIRELAANSKGIIEGYREARERYLASTSEKERLENLLDYRQKRLKLVAYIDKLKRIKELPNASYSGPWHYVREALQEAQSQLTFMDKAAIAYERIRGITAKKNDRIQQRIYDAFIPSPDKPKREEKDRVVRLSEDGELVYEDDEKPKRLVENK